MFLNFYHSLLIMYVFGWKSNHIHIRENLRLFRKYCIPASVGLCCSAINLPIIYYNYYHTHHNLFSFNFDIITICYEYFFLQCVLCNRYGLAASLLYFTQISRSRVSYVLILYAILILLYIESLCRDKMCLLGYTWGCHHSRVWTPHMILLWDGIVYRPPLTGGQLLVHFASVTLSVR